jgi:hypothetical protein
MTTYRFQETKRVFYDTFVEADSDEEAMKKYEEMEDSKKELDVIDPDTVTFIVYKYVNDRPVKIKEKIDD